MKVASMLIVLLANDGHWFADQDGSVSVQLAADLQVPQAVCSWQLMLGPSKISAGRLALRAGAAAGVVAALP